MAKLKPPGIEDLDVEGVVQLLEKNEMGEFVAFIRERRMDGRAFLTITEGTVKLWQPKANAMKLIKFIEQVKQNSAKFVESGETKAIKADMESQYQKVSAKSLREQNRNVNVSGVEEIIKRIVPPKSFLYRDRTAKVIKPIISYVPMNAGTPEKPKRFFRLSSYEYPHFDMKQLRFSNNETNCGDRGYYSIKTNSRYYLQKTFRKVEARTKYKSLSTLETVDKSEDHFYEDLCYKDVEKATCTSKEEHNLNNTNVKTYRVKIQELFSSFKLPFFKKTDDVIEGERRVEIENEPDEEEKDGHIYENSDSLASMYSSVREETETIAAGDKHHKLQVEEYLEPVQVHREYCDVTPRHKDDSILGYIRNLFGSFGIRWETNDADQSEESDDRPALPDDIRKSPGQTRTNMADRPLPVPVENEPYYMNIDRSEAENLLRGQPDGTFLLRPSGQPNHAYTLTVSCSGAVHNVGVRRRADGRLALGFARRGERSFPSVTSLLCHHSKRRLLLVAGGSVCGATTLNGSPEYYQTPSSLPLP